MPKVVGVRFNRATKVYYFDPAGFMELMPGDNVIVNTARGLEMGTVVTEPHDVPDEEIVGKLKNVVRRAEPWDLVQSEALASREDEALSTCKRMIAQHKLPMKLVRAEYSFDGSRLTFYFTSEQRVDFRALVRELAKIFKTRIELRQIGVRDEAKLLGGLGCCGRPLCCDSWLCEFSPVSIKMAKQQDLPLNPMEISGVCGRLLCCLSFENDFYAEARKRFPKVGRTVCTKQGNAKVIGHDVFNDTLKVQLENELVTEVALTDLLESSDPQATNRENVPAQAKEQSRERRSPEASATPSATPADASRDPSKSRQGKRKRRKRSRSKNRAPKE